MSDEGVNEIQIEVTVVNREALAAFEQTQAAGAELGRRAVEVPVTATNPITEEWRAQVNAGIESVGKDPVTIPVVANTEEVLAQLRALEAESFEIPIIPETMEARGQIEDTLNELRAKANIQVSLEPGNAAEFAASVQADIEALRTQIGAIVVPVQAEPQAASESQEAPMQGAEEGPVVTVPPQPGRVAAQTKLADMLQQLSAADIVVPVRASNPIDAQFVAEVRSRVKGIATDALDIQAHPAMEGFQAQLEETLVQLSEISVVSVPVDVADAMAFREEVYNLVQQIETATRVVVQLDIDEGALTDLQQKTVGAAQAALELSQAEQKLNTTLAGGSEDDIAKARRGVVDATKAEEAATQELMVAQIAAGQEATGLAEAEDVVAASSRGLGAAMGPLWMVMNVAQFAMMGFGSSSSSTSTQVQDVSQQIINLGHSAGTAATSLVGGSQSLQGMSGDLLQVGSNANQFAQAYSGSVDTATQYTNRLVQMQKTLGDQKLSFNSDEVDKLEKSMGDFGSQLVTASPNVAKLTELMNGSHDSYVKLPPDLKALVDQYNALHNIVPQAQDALAGMKAAAEANREALAALGYTMTDGQQAMNGYGLTVQDNAKALQDATSGAAYLEDATDKAGIAAGQGVEQWKQLQAAVVSAGQQVASAGQQIESASHSVVTAEQGVDSARHSQQQSVIAAAAAQTQYTNAVYQEGQAQAAVTAARQQAQAALVSLSLQANDSAASALSANANLFDAQKAANQLGVNPDNAQALASQKITSQNENQVKAAIALIQAQNQVADSQNSSATAQANLNAARQQGVDNNPQVLSSEHTLAQSKDAVTTASQGEANAAYAEQQAALAVTNAQYGVKQAEEGVRQAEDQLKAAQQARSAAIDAESRSTDANTLAGAQNRQTLANLFVAYDNMTGSEQEAAAMTQQAGQAMGFTSGQIGGVIASLTGLNGMEVQFSITGTPSVNPGQLNQVLDELGLSYKSRPSDPVRGPHAAQAVGGPGGGWTWVGEQGAELVNLPPGSQVMPHANSMQLAAEGQVRQPGKASGGPVGAADALALNFPAAAGWGAYGATAQVVHALGGPSVSLPPATGIDWGALGGMPGSVPGGGNVSGNKAANKEIMQQVFAQFGWGSGAEWAAQDFVEMREAGYDNMAQNPTSTAFGMGQLLNGTWAGTGIAKTSDPTLQSLAMARYEGSRYGDPIGAAAHERAFNWYASGGPSGGLSVVGDRGPELVRVPGGGSGSPSGGGSVQVELTVNFAGNTDTAFASYFMRAVRTGQIQLTAGGQKVKVG